MRPGGYHDAATGRRLGSIPTERAQTHQAPDGATQGGLRSSVSVHNFARTKEASKLLILPLQKRTFVNRAHRWLAKWRQCVDSVESSTQIKTKLKVNKTHFSWWNQRRWETIVVKSYKVWQVAAVLQQARNTKALTEYRPRRGVNKFVAKDFQYFQSCQQANLKWKRASIPIYFLRVSSCGKFKLTYVTPGVINTRIFVFIGAMLTDGILNYDIRPWTAYDPEANELSCISAQPGKRGG